MTRLKQSILGCSIVLLSLTLNGLPAKANEGHRGRALDERKPNSNSGTANAPAHPISNEVCFLIVACAAIGCKIITDKVKFSKVQLQVRGLKSKAQSRI